MGYETKLIIGTASTERDEVETLEPITENGESYSPYKKDSNGNLVLTGRKEIWFDVYVEINLCKCGYTSNIRNIKSDNRDKNKFWFFYGSDGNTKITKDRYDDIFKPVDIEEVINALEKDAKSSDYRRFKWALSLLKSMKESRGGDDLKVILYGY